MEQDKLLEGHHSNNIIPLYRMVIRLSNEPSYEKEKENLYYHHVLIKNVYNCFMLDLFRTCPP